MRLTHAQRRALAAIGDRQVVAVWHSDLNHPGLGWKPWFAMSGGVLPRQLHILWLRGLIRVDRGAGVYELASAHTEYGEIGPLHVGRARLTPAGHRARDLDTGADAA